RHHGAPGIAAPAKLPGAAARTGEPTRPTASLQWPRPSLREIREHPQMPPCFIEPQDAIRVIAESVGREARRQLLGELVRAWVDVIPDEELASHYAKAVAAS